MFTLCLFSDYGRLAAQQQVGGLRVLVTDQTGGAIRSAEVEFRSPALIRAVLGVTDEQGLDSNGNLSPEITT